MNALEPFDSAPGMSESPVDTAEIPPGAPYGVLGFLLGAVLVYALCSRRSAPALAPTPSRYLEPPPRLPLLASVPALAGSGATRRHPRVRIVQTRRVALVNNSAAARGRVCRVCGLDLRARDHSVCERGGHDE